MTAYRSPSLFSCLPLALFLVACGGGGGGDSGTPPGGGTTPPPPVLITAAEASRFLARASYGPTEAEISALTGAQNYNAWFDAQFNQALTSHLAWVDKERPNREQPDKPLPVAMAQESFWDQVANAPDPLRQRMVLALSEIFVISIDSSALSNEPYAFASYQDMLARNAFGNFRTLLEDVSLHPAMGRYLSHLANQKESTQVINGQTVTRLPDENYAREVMQLFAIGLWELNNDGSQKKNASNQPIPTYGQDEILGMAKVFTGWSWGHCATSDSRCFGGGRNNLSADPNFDRWRKPMQAFESSHSTAAKKIIGSTLPAGNDAKTDLKLALDALFNHPNVGPFIGKQLIQRLVTSNPSAAYVNRVANAFNNNGQNVRGDMKAVVKAILTDNEALAAATDTRSGKLREPVVRYGQFLRAFNVRAQSGYFRPGDLASTTSGIGQAPFRSPSVFNFFRPDYAPPGPMLEQGVVAPEFQITHEATVASYINYMNTAIYRSAGSNADILVPNFQNWLADAADSDKLLTRLDVLLTYNQLNATTRASLKTALDALPSATDTDKLNRVRTAVLLVMSGNDYLIQR